MSSLAAACIGWLTAFFSCGCDWPSPKDTPSVEGQTSAFFFLLWTSHPPFPCLFSLLFSLFRFPEGSLLCFVVAVLPFFPPASSQKRECVCFDSWGCSCVAVYLGQPRSMMSLNGCVHAHTGDLFSVVVCWNQREWLHVECICTLT